MIILFLFYGDLRASVIVVRPSIRCIGDHLYGGDGILNEYYFLTSLVLGVGMMVDRSITDQRLSTDVSGQENWISMMRRWKVRAR